jgi:hypothetical protein
VLVTYLVNDGIQLFSGAERKPMEHCLSKRSAGRLQPRLGPVYACQTAPVVAAVCVFAVADDDARVKQRAAYSPEHGRDLAGGQQVVDMDDDLGALEGEGAAVRVGRLARRLGTAGGGHCG